MRTFQICGQRMMQDEQGQAFLLRYEVTKDWRGSLDLYGLRVSKTPGCERRTLPALSYSRQEIEQLGAKLLEAGVTPVVLEETIDDYKFLKNETEEKAGFGGRYGETGWIPYRV